LRRGLARWLGKRTRDGSGELDLVRGGAAVGSKEEERSVGARVDGSERRLARNARKRVRKARVQGIGPEWREGEAL